MLGKLWDMKKMYDKYKELQKALKKLVIRAKEDGIVIEITWEQKIRSVVIEDDTLLDVSSKHRMETAILKAVEKWQAKAQEIAMEKTKDILGFDPNDMAGMMSGMWAWWGLQWLMWGK